MSFSYTQEQIDIFDRARRKLHIVVSAGAGTGKTFVLVNIAEEHYAESKKLSLYLAYNAALKNEAEEKIGHVSICKTVNSFAHSEGKKFDLFNPSRLKGKLNSEVIKKHFEIGSLTVGDHEITGNHIAFLALSSFGKYCYSDSEKLDKSFVTTGDWKKVLKFSEIVKLKAVVFPYAVKLKDELFKLDGDLPITHDTYMKLYVLALVRGDIPVLDIDLLCIDEFQDSNRATLQMVLVYKHSGCQIISVGDEHQCIYSWRGAANMMTDPQLLAKDTETLTLSQSFRFGVLIGFLASLVLKTFKKEVTVDDTIKGLPTLTSKLIAMPYEDANMIICRTNSGMMEAVIELTDLNIPVFLPKGEGIINEINAIKKLKNGKYAAHPSYNLFRNWEELVAYSETPDGGQTKKLIKFIEDDKDDIKSKIIARASSAKKSKCQIITGHASKGLEADNVIIWGDFKAKQVKEGQDVKLSTEETNLLYVAITRARRNLDITRVAYLAKPLIKATKKRKAA